MPSPLVLFHVDSQLVWQFLSQSEFLSQSLCAQKIFAKNSAKQLGIAIPQQFITNIYTV